MTTAYDSTPAKEDSEGRVRDVLGFTVEARDPYGFWFVKKGRGRLAGAFTTIVEAEKAIKQHLKDSVSQASAAKTKKSETQTSVETA